MIASELPMNLDNTFLKYGMFMQIISNLQKQTSLTISKLYLGMQRVSILHLQQNVEVMNLISQLPNKKSSGYDNIDNVILKHIKECISST